MYLLSVYITSQGFSSTQRSNYAKLFSENFGTLDVIFLLDGSDLVSSLQFEEMKKLVQNTMNGYLLEGSGTNVALGVYGANTQLSPSLTQQRAVLNNQLKSMIPVGGSRQMGAALRDAQALFGSQNSRRRVYVIFTAGNNGVSDSVSFEEMVNSVPSAGNQVAVVAIGNNVAMTTFRGMIQAPNHLFHALTLNGVPDLLNDLIILNMPVAAGMKISITSNLYQTILRIFCQRYNVS